MTYTLAGTDSSKFTINGSTGQISVASGANLDYETKSTYDLDVQYSHNGYDATIDVTVNVTNLDPPAKPAPPTLA